MVKNKTDYEEDGEINGVKTKAKKRKAVRDVEEAEDGRGEDDNSRKTGKKDAAEPETEPWAGEEETPADPPAEEDAKPIGRVVRVRGKGRSRRNHYAAFKYNGFQFDLDDPVLIVPKETKQKPRVAIIKDIYKSHKGSMMVAGQWFYRPEETEIRTGANWPSHDSRELFYSFCINKIPAESVMHRCTVHFIPLNKQIPMRSQHPGFFVQRIYDKEKMNLFKLSENDYEESRQHEIDLLVQKTFSRLGDLPDIESKDAALGKEDHLAVSTKELKEGMTTEEIKSAAA
ncbi:unnamed protein product [Cuscuta campestris]|uniref:BAH domain-containing protein n=1 Tax=Cuscuta campestris TaxID=132261 RepID=A0A484LR77_9ASTE|nr:unnamed protein product [Cuscuta campestris]